MKKHRQVSQWTLAPKDPAELNWYAWDLSEIQERSARPAAVGKRQFGQWCNMTIYVVMGSTGEYSDRSEWLVCAYTDKLLAEQHAFLAEKWALETQKEYEANDDGTWKVSQDIDDKKLFCPYDSQMHMDYTGTSYVALPVEVREALPEVV